jgi:hypothetical protein
MSTLERMHVENEKQMENEGQLKFEKLIMSLVL